MTVGRTVSNSFVVADDAQAGAAAVGRVNALTAGAVTTATVAANTFGTVKVTGYATPEGTFGSFVPGDVTAGTFTAASGGAGCRGLPFAVAGSFRSNSLLKAPFGVKALTVSGGVLASGIVVANPATPAAGVLTAATVGDLNGSSIRAGTIGTLKTTGNVGLGLLGNVSTSTVATTAGGPQAIGTLTVAGDIIDSARRPGHRRSDCRGRPGRVPDRQHADPGRVQPGQQARAPRRPGPGARRAIR